jgi:FMN reductase (NADPH)/FMN reductase [NAD(P)H]
MRRLPASIGMGVVVAIAASVMAFSMIAMFRHEWFSAAEPVVCPAGSALELRNASPVPGELVLEAACVGADGRRDVTARFLGTVLAVFFVPTFLVATLVVWLKGCGGGAWSGRPRRPLAGLPETAGPERRRPAASVRGEQEEPMNAVMDVILNRRSIRAYEDRAIPERAVDEILHAALRAPTAGNMMLYTVIRVRDQAAKDTLARTCDNQPFIARAPLVLLFLADYQRWFDYFHFAGVEELSRQRGDAVQLPEEADLLLACCDALIAAQTAVLAAESLGIGSCYIGDIMENYEAHRDLFHLPRYTFPICLLCFGYPTRQQAERPLTERFAREFIVFEDRYRHLAEAEFTAMFRPMQEQIDRSPARPGGFPNPGQMMYVRKFTADFSKEMRRSVRAMLKAWAPA